jgi:TolA-binding protein
VHPASNDWRELAKQGRYREAMAAADSMGFEAQFASGSAADLLTLGNTARLAGALGRAEDAFLTLRQRFPRNPSRAVAAFSLGKIAFDQKNDAQSAARWFRTCLNEAPSGALAQESQGRLLESLQRIGDRSGAEKVASEYLARYPDGPHAKLARAALPNGERAP